MLDLQNAFGTVDHVILGKKLKAMGVKSVDWFMSYLSNRSQIVYVNNAQSDLSLVTCGVHKEVFWALFFFFVMWMTWRLI